MIIAGPCSFINKKDYEQIELCALNLKGLVDMFRVKIWLGGTSPQKYKYGIGAMGQKYVEKLNTIMPTGIEVQTPTQAAIMVDSTSFFWVGARNSQNYGLLEDLAKMHNIRRPLFIKRGAGMTVDEIIGTHDIMTKLDVNTYIIERGINTFCRKDNVRWSISLNDILYIKNERPDVFQKLMIDCSHSAGRKDFVEDIYKANKAIGVKHFMFECTNNGKSETDQGHMLSVKELEKILRE